MGHTRLNERTPLAPHRTRKQAPVPEGSARVRRLRVRTYLLLAALLAALCLPAGAFAAPAATTVPDAAVVSGIASQVAAWEIAQLTSRGPTYGDEWALMALARAGQLPAALKQQYLAALSTYLKENGNSLGTTVTDYDRVILALTAMGVDARNFNGIDLCAPLADFDAITSQGISGSIYALLALDSHAYAVPELTAGSTGTPTTRAALTGAILAAQLPGGGWNWGFGSDPDPDLTAMALQTLAPYYHTGDAALDAAVDAGLGTLSAIQDDATAGFISVWLDPPAPTSESSAQALTALSALGIAPDDVRFTKTGGTFYDSLTSFLVNTGAGTQAFLNAPGDAAPDGMATEQGLYALAAFARFLSGDARLYDMTDTEIEAYVAEAGGSGNGTENPGSGTPGNGSGTSSGQEQAPAVTEPPATGASGTVSVPATTSAGSLPTTGDAISNLQLVTTALLLMGLATGLYATRRRSAVVAPDKR